MSANYKFCLQWAHRSIIDSGPTEPSPLREDKGGLEPAEPYASYAPVHGTVCYLYLSHGGGPTPTRGLVSTEVLPAAYA